MLVYPIVDSGVIITSPVAGRQLEVAQDIQHHEYDETEIM